METLEERGKGEVDLRNKGGSQRGLHIRLVLGLGLITKMPPLKIISKTTFLFVYLFIL